MVQLPTDDVFCCYCKQTAVSGGVEFNGDPLHSPIILGAVLFWNLEDPKPLRYYRLADQVARGLHDPQLSCLFGSFTAVCFVFCPPSTPSKSKMPTHPGFAKLRYWLGRSAC